MSKKHKAKNNHLFLKLMLLLGLLLIAAGFYWLLQRQQQTKVAQHQAWHVYYDPKQLPHFTHATLDHLIKPQLQGDFFTLDVDAIRAQLLKNEWIEKVAVRKIWPGSLFIDIHEQHAVARFNNAQLINDEGQVFSPPTFNKATAALPLIQGPKTDEANLWQNYNSFNQQLATLGLAVAQINENDLGCYRVRLSNSMPLQLGCVDPASRLARFIYLYPKVIGNKAAQVAYVDLRYDHGVAVKWR